MDIQKAAPNSAYAFAEIKRQRELATAREPDAAGSGITTGTGRPQIQADERSAPATPDELEAVLNRLNLPTELRKETGEPYHAIVSARAKYALNAYLAQADLPQSEARSALSQMLGVDEYA